jgi:hypothetical protein
MLVLAVACGSACEAPVTAAAHEELARRYDANVASIEHECWKARRNELTVGNPEPCWKANDIRFLTANRHAAAYHHAEAARLRHAEEEQAFTASR